MHAWQTYYILCRCQNMYFNGWLRPIGFLWSNYCIDFATWHWNYLKFTVFDSPYSIAGQGYIYSFATASCVGKGGSVVMHACMHAWTILPQPAGASQRCSSWWCWSSCALCDKEHSHMHACMHSCAWYVHTCMISCNLHFHSWSAMHACCQE